MGLCIKQEQISVKGVWKRSSLNQVDILILNSFESFSQKTCHFASDVNVSWFKTCTILIHCKMNKKVMEIDWKLYS